MVRLGKVHGNRMVDVAVTNSKLEDRALRILCDLAGIDRPRAVALLAAADGSVKLALLMALTGQDAASAAQNLTASGGSLRSALTAMAAD
jgi:N-acetylmuramic acid 6-phosphate etherase